jgi:hypothetical protein
MFAAEDDISQRLIWLMISWRDSHNRPLTQNISRILVFVQIVCCRRDIWPPELRLTEAIMVLVSRALYRILVLEDRAYSCELVCLKSR